MRVLRRTARGTTFRLESFRGLHWRLLIKPQAGIRVNHTLENDTFFDSSSADAALHPAFLHLLEQRRYLDCVVSSVLHLG